jgi:hypothetical protein
MALVLVADLPTETVDAADLLRMDDDGGMGSETRGQHLAASAGHVGGAGWGTPLGMIPGEREPGPQTRFAGSVTGTKIIPAPLP